LMPDNQQIIGDLSDGLVIEVKDCAVGSCEILQTLSQVQVLRNDEGEGVEP
jgi:hypothetical protein